MLEWQMPKESNVNSANAKTANEKRMSVSVPRNERVHLTMRARDRSLWAFAILPFAIDARQFR
jgi:hypothetical protein